MSCGDCARAYDEGYSDAIAEVVAWLRERGIAHPYGSPEIEIKTPDWGTGNRWADAIERGKHRLHNNVKPPTE